MRLQHEIPYPVGLPGLSPAEIAEAGRQAAAFLEGGGFQGVATAIRSYQGKLTQDLMSARPSNEGAAYADVVGELRGVAQFQPLLLGVIESGKAAEAELRAAEEGGQS